MVVCSWGWRWRKGLTTWGTSEVVEIFLYLGCVHLSKIIGLYTQNGESYSMKIVLQVLKLGSGIKFLFPLFFASPIAAQHPDLRALVLLVQNPLIKSL